MSIPYSSSYWDRLKKFSRFLFWPPAPSEKKSFFRFVKIFSGLFDHFLLKKIHSRYIMLHWFHNNYDALHSIFISFFPIQCKWMNRALFFRPMERLDSILNHERVIFGEIANDQHFIPLQIIFSGWEIFWLLLRYEIMLNELFEMSFEVRHKILNCFVASTKSVAICQVHAH